MLLPTEIYFTMVRPRRYEDTGYYDYEVAGDGNSDSGSEQEFESDGGYGDPHGSESEEGQRDHPKPEPEGITRTLLCQTHQLDLNSDCSMCISIEGFLGP